LLIDSVLWAQSAAGCVTILTRHPLTKCRQITKNYKSLNDDTQRVAIGCNSFIIKGFQA